MCNITQLACESGGILFFLIVCSVHIHLYFILPANTSYGNQMELHSLFSCNPTGKPAPASSVFCNGFSLQSYDLSDESAIIHTSMYSFLLQQVDFFKQLTGSLKHFVLLFINWTLSRSAGPAFTIILIHEDFRPTHLRALS